MNTNDVGNTTGKAIGPKESSADSEAGAVGDLSRSAIATIWRGQKQLRQRVLTLNSSGVFFRNITVQGRSTLRITPQDQSGESAGARSRRRA
jgi:hypothetical protein